MVIGASTSVGPPAGSTWEGLGANVAGAPLWQAAAQSAARRTAVSLEELKVVPQQQGDGTDGAAQGGKGRVPVDRPAQLRERDRVHEPVLDAEREDGAGKEGRLGNARLA